MKIIKLLLVFAAVSCAALFTLSCSAERSESPGVIPEDNIVTLEFYMEGTRAGGGPAITATINTETEKVLSYKLSDEILELSEMTEEEIDQILRDEMGVYYDDLSTVIDDPDIQNGPFRDLQDCLKGCNNDFEKGEGRGWCKAACWGDCVLAIAGIVLPFITVF